MTESSGKEVNTFRQTMNQAVHSPSKIFMTMPSDQKCKIWLVSIAIAHHHLKAGP
jgi:hypothetical protein